MIVERDVENRRHGDDTPTHGLVVAIAMATVAVPNIAVETTVIFQITMMIERAVALLKSAVVMATNTATIRGQSTLMGSVTLAGVAVTTTIPTTITIATDRKSVAREDLGTTTDHHGDANTDLRGLVRRNLLDPAVSAVTRTRPAAVARRRRRKRERRSTRRTTRRTAIIRNLRRRLPWVALVR